jgi:hypothetical protein
VVGTGLGLIVLLLGIVLVLRVLRLPARWADGTHSLLAGWAMLILGAAAIGLALIARATAGA